MAWKFPLSQYNDLIPLKSVQWHLETALADPKVGRRSTQLTKQGVD